MKKYRFLSQTWLLLAAFSLCVATSCSSDDDNNDTTETEQNGEGTDQTEGGGSDTPVATVGNAIDLGLSVKFADRNVGAVSIEDVGTQFAWAETETKEEFTQDNYFDPDYTIVTTDIFGSEHDAARVKWGGNWRMMSYEEFLEMDEKCTVETITQNGARGMKITGPNGNSIFMPYSYSNFGYYDTVIWTGKIMKNPYGQKTNSAAYIGAFINYAIDGPSISNRGGDLRYRGYYIRPVCE